MFCTVETKGRAPTNGWTRRFGWDILSLMSKAVKNAASQAAPSEDMPFEQALHRLESILEGMESDELPLETLIARFEEGTRLVRLCQAKLAEAEVKIQQLEQGQDGELSLKSVSLNQLSNSD